VSTPGLEDPLATVNPVMKRSAAAQVADQIVLVVREGRLRLGDHLPSERALAERLHVSRPTMREALVALELAGIVGSQKGRGTSVVRDFVARCNVGSQGLTEVGASAHRVVSSGESRIVTLMGNMVTLSHNGVVRSQHWASREGANCQ
jgi:DNA-binding GntR family transcriptional regulator